MKRLSIGVQVILFIGIIVLIAFGALMGIVTKEYGSYLRDRDKQGIVSSMTEFADSIQTLKDQSLQEAQLLAGNARLGEVLQSRDSARISTLLTGMMKDSKLDYVLIVDKMGLVLYRSQDAQKIGDSVKDRAGVQAALAGNVYSDIEKGGELPLACASAVPVKSTSGNIIGLVYTGISLGNSDFVDKRKALTGMECTVFAGDERLMTTLQQDGQRLTGTKATADISDAVINRQQTFIGDIKLFGSDYLTYYTPLVDSKKQTLGMLFLGQPMAALQARETTVTLQLILMMLATALVMLVLIYYFLRVKLSRPLKALTAAALQFALGDTAQAQRELQSTSGHRLRLSRSTSKGKAKAAKPSKKPSKPSKPAKVRATRDETLLLRDAFAQMAAATAEQAAAAEEIARGNADAALTVRSQNDVLGNSLSAVLAAMQQVKQQFAHLIEATRQGNFTQRGDESAFQGLYADMIATVNALLDNVVGAMANVERATRLQDKRAAYERAEVEHVVESLRKLSLGDLELDLAVAPADDDTADIKALFVGLNSSVAQCRDAITALVQDAALLSKAAVEGKLSTRADAGRHQGEFRAVVEGVNHTLEAVISPLNVAASYVDRISKGDIPPKITDSYNGDFNTIKDNLNTCIDAVNLLVGDANMLVAAAVEGQLSARADATRHQGEFRRIVEGVNATLDAVVGPLNTASQQLERLANGEDQAGIDVSIYRGDFKLIQNSLNRVRDSLNLLLQDTAMLTAAASEGKFHTRADASRHLGEYRGVIEGINNMLDAIVTPLNEFIAVLQRLAVNDYTTKVEGSYQGMSHEMGDAINTTLSRLLSVQAVLEEIATGDTGRLEYFRGIGRRSENDRMMPAVVKAMSTLETLVDEANRLSAEAVAGNLNARSDAARFEGKYNLMISGINATLDAMAAPLTEAVDVLSMMAANDYTTAMSTGYNGAFRSLAESVNSVQDTLNEVLSDLASAAEQVASGTRQVSDGSQALSQGATEQASAIEELSASVTEIAAQTKQNAMDAGRANAISTETREHALSGNSQMSAMLSSMNEINQASANISRIIKVIDDIAFQTNLLALNAAVEAARAGTHGKGFAVVAEEVRNLAARSANAAKETTAMIEGSMQKAAEGTRIANETAQALGKIVDGVEKATNLVSAIAKASSDQATAVAQVNRGIEQVSQVVQTNSATAEESAATSEELSGQAELLKEMVGRFQLRGQAKPTQQRALPASHANAKPARARISLNDREFGKY